MANAVIVDALRTPGGKRFGKLSGWHPADLAGEVLRTLVQRNDLDPALVEDVIMGCVMQAGAQSINVGRNAVLAAGSVTSVVGGSFAVMGIALGPVFESAAPARAAWMTFAGLAGSMLVTVAGALAGRRRRPPIVVR